MAPATSILEIEPAWLRESEDMGSKQKFWFRYQDEMWLFKQARTNTGEHWAEKIASEIATLLKLPTHEVQIARSEGRIGCAVRSFLKKDESLVHGNELLAGAIKGYDRHKQRGQAEHHFQNILNTIEKTFPNVKDREREALRLVGYFVFDALVGNTDRHHENWGVLLTPNAGAQRKKGLQITLAPTFDHGSSLGRELLDERARCLVADPHAMNRYLLKATGGVFANEHAKKGLSPIALVKLIAASYPELVRPWRNRIVALPKDFVMPLLAGVPTSCMSDISRKFVIEFLSTSVNMITSIL